MYCYRSHCNMKCLHIYLCYWGFQQISKRLGTTERIWKFNDCTWISNRYIKKVNRSWGKLAFQRTGSLATKSLGQICNFITRTDEVLWQGTKTINRQQLLHSKIHFSPALRKENQCRSLVAQKETTTPKTWTENPKRMAWGKKWIVLRIFADLSKI